MPITLNRKTWVVLFIVLLVVLPVVICLAFRDQIYASYVREFAAPRIQREFGFKAGWQQLPAGSERSHVFMIRSLQPGGPFEKAGFQSGDIPVHYKHGSEMEFYRDLQWVEKGGTVPLFLVNSKDAQRGIWEARKIVLNQSVMK